MAEFAQRYGPWALILGASDGTGAAFARQIAACGVPCVLIARRENLLAELAAQIRSQFGVECVIASIDLSQPDACDRIVAAVGDREVGLFVNNAGADSNGSHFLDKPVDNWLRLASINISVTMRCCHHFGALMKQRGRGGLLLVGSGACYGGAGYLATYSGAKAFVLCFAESLWYELRPYNVDVLHMALSTTDTPALRKLLQDKGKKPPRNLAAPDKVASVGLSRLAQGPDYNWGQLFGLRAGWRKLRVKLISYFSRKMIFE
jgi:uncharacterized protein